MAMVEVWTEKMQVNLIRTVALDLISTVGWDRDHAVLTTTSLETASAEIREALHRRHDESLALESYLAEGPICPACSAWLPEEPHREDCKIVKLLGHAPQIEPGRRLRG